MAKVDSGIWILVVLSLAATDATALLHGPCSEILEWCMLGWHTEQESGIEHATMSIINQLRATAREEIAHSHLILAGVNSAMRSTIASNSWVMA